MYIFTLCNVYNGLAGVYVPLHCISLSVQRQHGNTPTHHYRLIHVLRLILRLLIFINKRSYFKIAPTLLPQSGDMSKFYIATQTQDTRHKHLLMECRHSKEQSRVYWTRHTPQTCASSASHDHITWSSHMSALIPGLAVMVQRIEGGYYIHYPSGVSKNFQESTIFKFWNFNEYMSFDTKAWALYPNFINDDFSYFYIQGCRVGVGVWLGVGVKVE